MSPHSAGASPAAARDPRERETATVQAREQRNDKRARILDAAVKVFAERGYFSSTVAEIARAAGVPDGTIYLYFKSKGELTGSVSPGTAKRAIFGALDELALGWLLSGRRASLKKTGHEVAEWLVRGLVPHDTGGRE